MEVRALSASQSEVLRGQIAALVRERQGLHDDRASAFVLEQNRLAIVQAQLQLARALVSEHAPAEALAG